MVLHVFAIVDGFLFGRVFNDQLHFFSTVVGLFGDDVLGLVVVFCCHDRLWCGFLFLNLIFFGADKNILFGAF